MDDSKCINKIATHRKKGSLTHAAFTTTTKKTFLEKSIFFSNFIFCVPKLHNKRFLIIDPRESFFR